MVQYTRRRWAGLPKILRYSVLRDFFPQLSVFCISVEFSILNLWYSVFSFVFILYSICIWYTQTIASHTHTHTHTHTYTHTRTHSHTHTQAQWHTLARLKMETPPKCSLYFRVDLQCLSVDSLIRIS